MCAVHFGYVYDVWLGIAHGITYIWDYSNAQRECKLITGYRIVGTIYSKLLAQGITCISDYTRVRGVHWC